MEEAKKYEFSGEIVGAKSGGSGVIFPFDVLELFGVKGQVKINAWIDGEYYRGSLTPYGGQHYVGILKEIRKKIKKNIGDMVSVIVQQDFAERKVEVPEDFLELLSSDDIAYQTFQNLSYSHQREYVSWVDEAKKETTRQNRIQKAVQMLKDGRVIS